jgi:hypothetical protein
MGLFTTAIPLGNSDENKPEGNPLVTTVKNMFGGGIPLEPNPDDVETYNKAIDNRDKQGLLGLVQKDPNSEMGQVALNAIRTQVVGEKQLAALTDPVEKAGGVQTPEGRIAAQKTFETVKDHPQYGTALVRWVMGDKEGAARMLTGGDHTNSVVWDAEGNPYTKTTNALGEIVSILDDKNKPLSMSDVKERKISYGSYQDTIAGKNRAESQNLYTKAFSKATEANNAWSQFSASAAEKAKRIQENISGLNEVDKKTFNDVTGIITQSIGNGASSSAGTSILKNWQKGEGVRTGESISKEAQSSLGLGGLWKFDGKGGIVNDKGETKSFSELEQTQGTTNSAKENSNNIQQTQKSILEKEALGQLSHESAAKLLDALKSAQEIMKEQADVLERHGRPAFVSLPSGFGITDKVAQWEAQTHQIQYSKEVMDAFQDWKKNAMVQYNKTGMLPAPQELEAEFIKSGEYKRLQNEYSARIQGALNKSRALPSVTVRGATLEEQNQNKGGVAPPVKGQPSLLELKRKHGG